MLMVSHHRLRGPYRSSFVGTGAYAAHWTGDSASTWWDLRWQVTAVLAPGLVGISFSGADICGGASPSLLQYTTAGKSSHRFPAGA